MTGLGLSNTLNGEANAQHEGHELATGAGSDASADASGSGASWTGAGDANAAYSGEHGSAAAGTDASLKGDAAPGVDGVDGLPETPGVDGIPEAPDVGAGGLDGVIATLEDLVAQITGGFGALFGL